LTTACTPHARGGRARHCPGRRCCAGAASLILAKLRADNDDQRFGIEIVRKAIQTPLGQIAENAGEDGAAIAGKTLETRIPDVQKYTTAMEPRRRIAAQSTAGERSNGLPGVSVLGRVLPASRQPRFQRRAHIHICDDCGPRGYFPTGPIRSKWPDHTMVQGPCSPRREAYSASMRSGRMLR
jgi:hypothetical protein